MQINIKKASFYKKVKVIRSKKNLYTVFSIIFKKYHRIKNILTDDIKRLHTI